MPNLITLTDIRLYWPVSMNLDANRTDPHIARAESNEFKKILSPELYQALKSATIVVGDRFDKLMNGELYRYGTNYDVEWEGAKKLLCAYAYSIIVDANPVHVTRGGNVNKQTDQSQKVEDKNTSLTSQASYGEAIRLEAEFLKWISQKNNIYPEYNGGHPAKNTTFNISNLSRPIRYGYRWDEPKR